MNNNNNVANIHDVMTSTRPALNWRDYVLVSTSDDRYVWIQDVKQARTRMNERGEEEDTTTTTMTT